MAVKFNWDKYSRGIAAPPGMEIWKRIINAEVDVTQKAISQMEKELEKELERKKGIETGAQVAVQEVAKGLTRLVNYVIRNDEGRIVAMTNNPEEVQTMLTSFGVPEHTKNIKKFRTRKETHLPEGYTVYNQVLRGKKKDYVTIDKLPNFFEINAPIAITGSLRETGMPHLQASRESSIAPSSPPSSPESTTPVRYRSPSPESTTPVRYRSPSPESTTPVRYRSPSPEEKKGGKEKEKTSKYTTKINTENPFRRYNLIGPDGRILFYGPTWEEVRNRALIKGGIPWENLPEEPKYIPPPPLKIKIVRAPEAEKKPTITSSAKTTPTKEKEKKKPPKGKK